MIQKKSVYVIDAIADETTSLVRKGSMVRLSSGVGEFILLSDWSSGAFSAQSYYDINMNSGGFKFKKDLPENGAGFDLTLTDYLSFPNLSMLIDVNVYDNESDESSRCLVAVGEGQDEVVLIGNGTTSVSYNGGVVKIGNNAVSNFILNGTIHFNKSSDKTYPSNSITIGEIYTTIPSASVGMNNNITLNAASIVTNATNIALVKQSQTNHATGITFTGAIGGTPTINHCRVSRSTYITNVNFSASVTFSESPTSLRVEFPFSVTGAIVGQECVSGAMADSVPKNIIVIGVDPLIIDIDGYSPPEDTQTGIVYDFSILGTW